MAFRSMQNGVSRKTDTSSRSDAQTKKPELDQLIHAALIEYPRYVHPETLKTAEPEEVITWIANQKHHREAWPDRIEAFGFTPWKARQLRQFIPRYQHQTLRFRRKGGKPSADCQAAICWGERN